MCYNLINVKKTEGKKLIGERIRILRKRRGLTQSALASSVGVTDKAVSKWERGLSSPDISLLAGVSWALGVSVDELLGEASLDNAERGDNFISLEKYLMGEYGYVVWDVHPEGERVALIMDSPDMDEAQHGYPLSARSGTEFNKYIFSSDASLLPDDFKELSLGVTYVSNVPLLNLNPPLGKLVDELEYTRLNRYHINKLLLESFMKKMERLVRSDTVRVIALTRWFNQKYFGQFIAYASPDLLKLMQDKISGGELRIIYVGLPQLWNDDRHKKYDGLFELKSALTENN